MMGGAVVVHAKCSLGVAQKERNVRWLLHKPGVKVRIEFRIFL
jgi:hypothetical protein